VENGNIEALSLAIKTLYDAANMRIDMSNNAKKMFDERFDRQKTYPQIIKEIEQVLLNEE